MNRSLQNLRLSRDPFERDAARIIDKKFINYEVLEDKYLEELKDNDGD